MRVHRTILVALLCAGASARATDPSAVDRWVPGVDVMTKSPSAEVARATTAAIEERSRDLVACYEQHLPTRPEIGGLALTWTLRGDGSISRPRIAERSDGLANSVFLDCVTSRIASFSFPGAAGGAVPVRVILGFFSGRPREEKRRSPEAGSEANASTTVPKQQVREVLRSHASEIWFCHAQQRRKNEGLEGTVTVRWTIQPDGSVSDATIDEAGSTLADKTVHRCMLSRIGAWRFPKQKDGAHMVVNSWALGSKAHPAPSMRSHPAP